MLQLIKRSKSSAIYNVLLVIIFIIKDTHCGLLSGDLKLKSKPLTINSHHAPINININTDKLKATLPSLSLPKPAKPPPSILSDLFKPSKPDLSSLLKTKFPKLPSKSNLPFELPKLSKVSSLSKPKSLFPEKSIFSGKSAFPSIPSKSKLTRSSLLSKPEPLSLPKLSDLPSISKPLTKLSKPKLPPIFGPRFPKLPFLPPVIPPLPIVPLIPLIPPFPLLPPILPIIPPIIPGVPFIPPIINPLKPLRVPILGGKSPLQKALGSEIRPVIAEFVNDRKNEMVEKKLRKLLERGSLTTAEFNRFKKILVG